MVSSDFTEKFSGPPVQVPGSLRVFREWLVSSTQRRSEVKLKSLAYDVSWESRKMSAKCIRYSFWSLHPTPLCPDPPNPDNCTCGIYGYYTNDALPSVYKVRGTVRVSGRVLMGSLGVRAQHAEIESLCFPDELFHYALSMSYFEQFMGAVEVVTSTEVSILENLYRGAAMYSGKQSSQWKSDFPSDDVSALLG